MSEEAKKTDATETEAESKSGLVSRTRAALVATAGGIKVAGRKVVGAPTTWWGKRSKRLRLGLLIGVPTAVVILVGVAVFLVLFLRPSFAVAVEGSEPVVSGEDVVFSVDVCNEGRVGGECELGLLLDGEPVETQSVSLGTGEQERVEFTLSGLAAGLYDVTLEGWPEVTDQVWVMTPAEFEISEVIFSPDPVDIIASTEAEVTVEVANVGEAPGSYELEVAFGDAVLGVREVEVEGEGSVAETFPIALTEAGSFEVLVNDEPFALEVYELWRYKNGAVLAKQKSGRYSCLKIENDSDSDCIVVLQKQGEDKPPFVTVYVRAQSEATVTAMPSGTFDCYYLLGQDWCRYREEFISDQQRVEFDEQVTIIEDSKSKGIDYKGIVTFKWTYTVATVTVDGADGDSLSTTPGTTFTTLRFPPP